MISERDYNILRAFLEREALMYHWKDETGREEFVDRMFKTILEYRDDKLPIHGQGYNYIRIQSITNMGLLDSELMLTADPWNSERSLVCLLPPSPRGGIGFSEYLSGSL